MQSAELRGGTCSVGIHMPRWDEGSSMRVARTSPRLFIRYSKRGDKSRNER